MKNLLVVKMGDGYMVVGVGGVESEADFGSTSAPRSEVELRSTLRRFGLAEQVIENAVREANDNERGFSKICLDA